MSENTVVHIASSEVRQYETAITVVVDAYHEPSFREALLKLIHRFNADFE